MMGNTMGKWRYNELLKKWQYYDVEILEDEQITVIHVSDLYDAPFTVENDAEFFAAEFEK